MTQGQDQFTVPRRPLDFEDYIDILRRHASWILGPALAALVIAVVVAFLWPDTYRSTAAIRVLPAQVPERFVASNVNVELVQRINSMAQNILSRATLTNIIQSYGLYPRDIKRLPMEDIIEKMRNKDIRIGDIRGTPGRNTGGAFTISFDYENRYLAQKVCQDLVGKFINENANEGLRQSQMTTNFLQDQLVLAKKNLDQIEAEVTAFKVANAGRLPEERQTNIAALNSLDTRMSALNQTLGRLNQDKLMIESEIRRMQGLLKQANAEPVETVSSAARSERLIQIEREIQQTEQTLLALKDRYTDINPDVRRVQANLEVLRKQRDDISKQEQSKPQQAQGTTRKNPAAAREARDLELAISRLQTTAQAKDAEIEETQKQIAAADRQSKIYSSRIESSPLGEQKLAQLQRDYDNARTVYQDLSTKMTQSERATKLEDRKQGETLEMLDQASLPENPIEPKRWIIISGGAAIGLLIGLVLAGAREMKDTALKNLKDVRAYTNLTILGSVPLLENDLVVRRRRQLTWLAWSTAGLVSFAVISGSIFYYYSTKL